MTLWLMFASLLAAQAKRGSARPRSNIIISQQVDTLPEYGHKTLDVRRSTDVYPAMDVNFAF